jgi:hypothetical protein
MNGGINKEFGSIAGRFPSIQTRYHKITWAQLIT